MNDYNLNINENNIEVNRYIQFIEFIKDEEKENIYTKTIEEKKREIFFNRIPEIHKEYVKWIIKKKFKNDANEFIKCRQKFLDFYTVKLRDLANGDVCRMGASKKDIRSANKRKKEALLYASQLLGLVGNGGSHYLNRSLVDYYVEEQKEQENFLENFRLINASGKICKLVNSEKKKERQLAQTLNISSAISKIAKDRDYVYCLLTLTLPGSFHPLPMNGRSMDGFNGVMPSQAQRQIQKFWEDIRANLAKAGLHSGSEYFGAITLEGMKSSVLHKHALLYSSLKHQAIIYEVVKEVEQRWSKKFGEPLNFDISEYDEKKGASGATYIFKYITKTSGSYVGKDEVILKNMALRSFYSARAFEFFGIKKVVAKFNFLIENYEEYKEAYSNDIQDMFMKFDYYSFITKYEKYFRTVRDSKKRISYVMFDLAGNSLEKIIGISIKQIVIEKKIFSIFETSEAFTESLYNKKKIDDISMLDENDINNVFAFKAYKEVINKKNAYDIEIEYLVNENKSIETFRIGSINIDKANFELLKEVTVIQSFSRKSENAKTKDKEKPKINDES